MIHGEKSVEQDKCQALNMGCRGGESERQEAPILLYDICPPLGQLSSRMLL